jgi:hypothetical protein
MKCYDRPDPGALFQHFSYTKNDMMTYFRYMPISIDIKTLKVKNIPMDTNKSQ